MAKRGKIDQAFGRKLIDLIDEGLTKSEAAAKSDGDTMDKYLALSQADGIKATCLKMIKDLIGNEVDLEE